MRVYISSPYESLQDERNAVTNAVLDISYEPIGMEHYQADSRPPLKLCLSDVQGSDIYVGILGLQYGSCPTGQSKSYTHLEFQEAALKKIPRLIFIHQEGINPRFRNMLDEDNEGQGLTTKAFQAPHDLAESVLASIHRHVLRMRDIKPLLYYECNRNYQRRCLRDAVVKYLTSSPHRPFLMIAHGRYNQAVDAFAKSVCELRLPQWISSRSLPFLEPHSHHRPHVIHHLPIRAPHRDRTVIEQIEDFGRDVSMALSWPLDPSREELRQRCADLKVSPFFHLHMSACGWSPEFIVRFLDFWRSWPDSRSPIFVGLIFTYEDVARYRFWTGSRRRFRRTCDQLRAHLEALTIPPDGSLWVIALRELSSVKLSDALDWARLPDVSRLVSDPEQLQERIRTNIYSRHGQSRPMLELAQELMKIMHEFAA